MSLRLLIGPSMRRVLTLSALSVLAFAAVLVGAVFPTPAYAAVPNISSMGGPLNVLPSAVYSGSGAATGGASQADLMIATMYKASKSPEFWALYKQSQATALATGKEIVLSPEVAAEAKTVYPAASKVAPFIKGAGAVGAAFTAYSMSSTLANGAMDFVGFDATGKVCTGTGSDLWGTVVRTAAGANCSGMGDVGKDFVANEDASGGYGFTSACDAEGTCISGIVGTKAGPYGSNTYVYIIMNGSGGRAFGGNVFFKSKAYPDSTAQQPWECIDTGFNTAGYCTKGQYIAWYQVPGHPGEQDAATAEAKSVVVQGVKPQGQPQVPATPGSADPSRTIKCVVAGTDGKQYVSESDPFFESKGVIPDPKCRDLPAGVQAQSVQITETGGDNGETPLWDAQTDPAVLDATKACGNSTATQCDLVLSKNGQSCFEGANCQGWFQEADKSPYKCTYGGKAVDLSECTVYAPRWEPHAQQTGNTLGNPQTGAPMPNPRPELSPGSDTNASGRPVTDPDSSTGSKNCLPSGTAAFNPINWVMMPVQCALEWAFVPRESVINSKWNSMRDATSKSGIGSFQTIVAGFTGFVAPNIVCQGPPLTLNVDHWGLHATSYPFDACSEPMKGAAATTRTIIGAVLSLMSTLAVVRYVTSIFGGIQFGSGTQESSTTLVDSRTGEVL